MKPPPPNIVWSPLSSQDAGGEPPIPVTEPYLPPIEEFVPYLERIWASKWLTNAGQFHQQLERELADYLGVRHLSLFSNGTIALIVALQCLRISGEVITTPYSFVATAHSLLWNNIKPVFADIDPVTFNLDPASIEPAITGQTTAIMPVHCYGNPCDVTGIQDIADRYGLHVIYDAAHAFAVRYKDRSLLDFGDLSVLSFHATKVFNTFEGGAIICGDEKTKRRIDHLKNFGFVDEVTVAAPGINGKMNEVQAAFGLLQLQHVQRLIEKRAVIDARYRELLAPIAGINPYQLVPGATANHSYFPVLVDKPYRLERDQLYTKLRAENILARRYFYPLISDFPMYRALPSAQRPGLPNAAAVADKVLCLPIYPELTTQQQDRIVRLIEAA